METLDLARYFADFINRYGAENVQILQAQNSKMFDYLIVCTAPSKEFAQNLLVDLLSYAKNEFNQINSGLEGYKKAEWIIVDYGKLLVHILSPQNREKFCLEKLWN